MRFIESNFKKPVILEILLMKKVAIISSGYFPVPAVKGGAVETLIENIAIGNEANKEFQLTIYSTIDDKAKEISDGYKNTNVRYVKDKWLVEHLDLLIYTLAKKVIKSDNQMSFRYIAHRIMYIIGVANNLKKANYDYVIIENTATLFWTLKLFGNSKRYRDKYVYHLHNEIGSTFGCKKLLRNSRKVLGVSEFVNSTIKEVLPGMDNNKFEVLYNSIDIDKIQAQKDRRYELRKKLGFSDDDIVLIFVGRLCKDKGIEELLEAFITIDQTNVKLLIVGNYYFGTNLVSNFEKHLHDMIENKKDVVIFTGFVPNSDIGAYYHSADIAVLPSIWCEPAGLTMIEAMAASLPVITTNVGGIPEYVGNDNALILDYKSDVFTDDLKKAILKLVNDRNMRVDLGRKASKRVRLFGSCTYASNLNSLLK